MTKTYFLFYDSRNKRRRKRIELADKALNVRCNNSVKRYGRKGCCVKVSYNVDHEYKERFIPMPKDAENIIINPLKAMARGLHHY